MSLQRRRYNRLQMRDLQHSPPNINQCKSFAACNSQTIRIMNCLRSWGMYNSGEHAQPAQCTSQISWTSQPDSNNSSKQRSDHHYFGATADRSENPTLCRLHSQGLATSAALKRSRRVQSDLSPFASSASGHFKNAAKDGALHSRHRSRGAEPYPGARC